MTKKIAENKIQTENHSAESLVDNTTTSVVGSKSASNVRVRGTRIM